MSWYVVYCHRILNLWPFFFSRSTQYGNYGSRYSEIQRADASSRACKMIDLLSIPDLNDPGKMFRLDGLESRLFEIRRR